MKTPADILVACGDDSVLENFSLFWTESMAEYPGTAELPFLKEESIRESASMAGFPQEVIQELLLCAKAIQGDETLARLAWHAYWRIFLSQEPCGIVAWPEPPQLGDARGELYLLVALGFVPLMRKHHQEAGIPDEVIVDTAKQVWHFCNDNYQRGNAGRLGVYQGQLNWLRNYTRENYLRLGRLEFWLQPTKQEYRVYRHRHTGQVVVFLPPGERLLEDGYYPNGKESDKTFLTTFCEDEETIQGTPCTAGGFVSPKEITLSTSDWELVLKQGDNVLAMHIPSGGGMTPEACQDAFRQGKEFFATHFPQQTPKAITCASWIFNTQLQEILPAESNLCRLQRLVHLLPVAGAWGLWFIFLKEWPFDTKTAPRETSLQRSILDYLEQGHDWRIGQMVLLMDEIN